MKKLLALVLALVMTLSLCVTSNAAFADADKIEHTEAVDVMNALGVINGKPDGNFDPAGNVTRAEMAKMITIIMLGDVDASAFTGTVTDLKDVDGHWAEGYIKYCYSQGVIAGKGNGLFDPNANVTAAEAAKMLLVAIGYDAKIQEYTGANWTINVTRDAQVSGFYADLKGLSAAKVLTRDEAAQMIWNAVQADGVEVKKGWNSEDNKITYSYQSVRPLLETTFYGDNDTHGILTSISYNKVKDTYTYTVGGSNFTMAGDYSEFFGMDVTVLQNTKTATTNEYALYIHEGGLLGECYATDLDFDDLVSDKELGADKTYETSATTLTYREFNNGTCTQDDSSLASVKLIDTTGDNKVDTLVYLPFAIDKVTYVGKDNVTLKDSGNVKLADVAMYDGVAKDDYAKVVAAANTVKNTTTFTKLTAETATVDAYKTVSGSARYQVAGVWMKDPKSKLNGATSVGATVEYFAFSKVIYDLKVTSGAQSVEDMVMVADYTSTATVGGVNTYTAKLVFFDGSSKTAELVDANGDPAAPASGTLYTYEVNNSGKYVLTAVSAANKAGYDTVGTASLDLVDAGGSNSTTNVIKSVDDNSGTKTFAIADDAVVFWHDTGKHAVKVYSGKELKSLPANTALTVNAYATDKANGFEDVAVLAVQSGAGTWPGFTVGNTYAYLTSDAYTTYDNTAEKWYVNYTMWTANGEVTAKEEGKTLTDRVAGNLVCYNTIDDGIVKDLRVVDANYGVVTGWDGSKKIALTGTANYNTEVVADTQIIYVDSEDKAGVEGGAITIGADRSGDGVADVYNVRYIKHATKDQLEVIVVDVNNDMAAGSVRSIAFTNVADIATAGTIYDKVIVTGAATLDANLTVAAGKTVEFAGAVTFNSKTITGAAGAKVVFDVQTADNAPASAWYTTAGAAPTTAGGSDGTAGTAISSAAVAAGTYAWGTVYTNTNGTTAYAWVEQ